MMKQEKLQALLHSFIENRESFDTVDGVGAEGYTSVKCDKPFVGFENSLPSIQNEDFVLPYGGPLPVSPPHVPLYASLTPAQSSGINAAGRTLALIAAEISSCHPEKSAIKFEKHCIIVAPQEQIISIPVIRSENFINKVTKVNWKTCDKTAKSGIHFIGHSGEITFNEGETRKCIDIQILKCVLESKDFRFKVEICDQSGLFDPKPMTVTLQNVENFYDDERQVIDNLPSRPFSVDDLKSILNHSMTSRTFHLVLSHVCSTEDSISAQFALAFELSRLCMRNLREESIMHILTDFFRMDDIDF